MVKLSKPRFGTQLVRRDTEPLLQHTTGKFVAGGRAVLLALTLDSAATP